MTAAPTSAILSAANRRSFDLNSLSDPSGVFELIETVGSGTYGDVYKAKDVQTSRVAAVKIIKLEPGDNFSIIQQEILMMKSCQHPNIVAFYGSYLRRDKLWICMEFCGGGSLQDIYHVTGPLSEPQISLVCRETLKGLSYLHSLNMMHRDIKGANILLTADGDVKLADFGVSAQITATMRKRKSFIGSPYWMAPEVAAVERKGGYNQQCDIWSVGITAIELYELQPPMFDMHPMKALNVMSRSNFKPPSLKDKNRCSESYKNFVKSALIKSPRRRPPADVLLKHPFVNLEMPKQLMKDLLARAASANEFNHFPLETNFDEERMLMEIPKKLPSAKPAFRDVIRGEVTQREPQDSHISRQLEIVNIKSPIGPAITSAITKKISGMPPHNDNKPPEVPPRRKDRKRSLTTVGFPVGDNRDDTKNNSNPQRYSIQELPRTPGRYQLPPPPNLPPPPPPASQYSTARAVLLDDYSDNNGRTLTNDPDHFGEDDTHIEYYEDPLDDEPSEHEAGETTGDGTAKDSSVDIEKEPDKQTDKEKTNVNVNLQSDAAKTSDTSEPPQPLPRTKSLLKKEQHVRRLQELQQQTKTKQDSISQSNQIIASPSTSDLQVGTKNLNLEDTDSNKSKTFDSQAGTQKRSAPSVPTYFKRQVMGSLDAIEEELNDLGDELTIIDKDLIMCEKILVEPNQVSNLETTRSKFIGLIKRRNTFARRQKELTYRKRQLELEQLHSDIEYELRIIVNKQLSASTKDDENKEKELLKKLVDVVDEKNDIFESLNKDTCCDSVDIEEAFRRLNIDYCGTEESSDQPVDSGMSKVGSKNERCDKRNFAKLSKIATHLPKGTAIKLKHKKLFKKDRKWVIGLITQRTLKSDQNPTISKNSVSG